MAYCELWLESMRGMSTFRVALLAPEGFDLPKGFSLAEVQKSRKKKLYLSECIVGIKAAKKEIETAAQFYSNRKLKFLLFREIREPTE